MTAARAIDAAVAFVHCDPHELARLARAGDLAALDRLTRCAGDRLLAVARRHCRDAEDARDAVQDALVAAGEHLGQFRGDGSLEGWVLRMVARACGRRRRGRKNDPLLHDAEVELAGDGDPAAEAERSELAGRLGEALLALDPQDRAILLLAEGEDWTGPQIAEATGLSAEAVRARLSRARRRLRARLAPLDPAAA